jgi:hypothetical protein
VNSKARNTILTILGILGVIALIFFVFNDKKEYSWNETYRAGSDQPYGALFIQKLLEENLGGGKFAIRDKGSLQKLLEKKEFTKNTKYVFIGESLYLSATDKDALGKFIRDGNEVFIAAKEMPEFITDLYSAECNNLVVLDENHVQTATLNFYHPTLQQKYGYKYSYRVMDMDVPYDWYIFNEGLFCDSTRLLTPLGYQEPGEANFIRIKHGDGYIYLHSNPIVFTNLFLIQKQKMDYASAVFSHLEGKNVIWEEFGKIRLAGGDPDGFNSPLYYIMQQPSLKYAWWLIVAATLLYVLFAAKRTQRVIPVLEPKTNTSLEFVKMIAALHYQNKNHMDMARKKMKYFYYFIRSKYGIHGHPFSEEMTQRLSEKSKVPLGDVKAVFKFNKLVEEGSGGAIDEIRLANFYNVIENFYKQCK